MLHVPRAAVLPKNTMKPSSRKIEFKRTIAEGVYSFQIHREVGSAPFIQAQWNGDCPTKRFFFDAQNALYSGLAWRLTKGHCRLAVIDQGRKAAIHTGQFDKKYVRKVHWGFETRPQMNGCLRCSKLEELPSRGSGSAILRLDTWEDLRVSLWAPQDAYSECSVLAVREKCIEDVESLFTRADHLDLPSVLARTELLVHLMQGDDLGTSDAVTVCATRDIQAEVQKVSMETTDAIARVEEEAKTANTPAEFQGLLRRLAGNATRDL